MEISNSLLAVGVLIFVAILLICATGMREGFTSIDQKTQDIYDWWKVQKNPSYVKYREYFKGKSNIVEYYDGMVLFNSKKITLEAIRGIL